MKHIIGPMIFILLFLFCDQNSTDIETSQVGVKIIVTDENKNPLSSVDCHYIFYLSDKSIIRNSAISLSLTVNDTGSLSISHVLINDKIEIFQDKNLLIGNHMFIVNSSKYKLTNGIYQYELKLKNKTILGNLPFVYDIVDTLISYPPLVRSDNNGEIFLPYDVFHLGENFGSTEYTRLISDSIDIVLYKEGYNPLRKSVVLSSTKTNVLNCLFEN
jgi:hypothetical protein